MRRQSQFFVGRVVCDVVIVAVGAELVAVVGFVCRGNSPRIAHCGHADARALRQGCQRNHETLVIGKIEVRAFVIRDDYVSGGSVHRKSGILIEIDSAADAAGLVISYRTARNCKRTVGILPSAVAEQEYSASVYIAFVVFYNAAVHHKFGAPTGGNTAAVTVSDVIFDDAAVQSNLTVRFHADTAAAPCRGISSDTAAVHNKLTSVDDDAAAVRAVFIIFDDAAEHCEGSTRFHKNAAPLVGGFVAGNRTAVHSKGGGAVQKHTAAVSECEVVRYSAVVHRCIAVSRQIQPAAVFHPVAVLQIAAVHRKSTLYPNGAAV